MELKIQPYFAIVIGWIVLGITTGVVATFPLVRLIYIIGVFYLNRLFWNILERVKRVEPIQSNDLYQKKLKWRITFYSRDLFEFWIAVLLQHGLWNQSGYLSTEEWTKYVSYTQSSIIVFCVTMSFLSVVSKSMTIRCIIKWIMILFAFCAPPYRDAWYAEPLIVLQLRWMIMVVLFVIQSFESYTVANREKGNLSDLYCIRIGWVPFVNPLFLLFAIVCVLYYMATMLRIKIETKTQQPEEPIPTQYKTYNSNLVWTESDTYYNNN